jgi:hypothetical protein
VLVYPAAMNVSTRALRFVTDALAAQRRQSSPKPCDSLGWKALSDPVRRRERWGLSVVARDPQPCIWRPVSRGGTVA